MKFTLFAGMTGSFGGAEEIGTYDFDSREQAEQMAYDKSIEIYQEYEGLYGILTRDEVAEDLADSFYDGDLSQVPEQEIDNAYTNEMESWVESWVEEAEDED